MRAFLLALLFYSGICHAHPMNFGELSVKMAEGDRLLFTLRLHDLSVSHFALGGDLFARTLEPSPPRFGDQLCHWRKPELRHDGEYQELQVVAVCTGARHNRFALELPLPFLARATSAFQLAVRLEGNGEPVTFVANKDKTTLNIGATDTRTLPGFVRLGMDHIGATLSEWKGEGRPFHFPEGIDHICFVLALVVAGGTLWNILKNISGFTLGHSLTLALATFQIIHIHSRWVEAFIALSIAVVAAGALFRPRGAGHRWVVAAIFGLVHGLAFASVLHDLALSRGELITALFGFNLGVELGQALIVLLALGFFQSLKKLWPRAYWYSQKTLAAMLLLVGTYWFLVRAID